MLTFRERPPSSSAQGLLVLHHGRGTDETDLMPLADLLDPERRLHVFSPRAPLPFPGTPGYRWYETRQVGFPDPASFRYSYAELSAFHDQLWERTGLEPSQTVLGGFSMGTVMSFALGLGSDRPAPSGILGFSGFLPTVEGWEPDREHRDDVRVFIAHGRQDPVIRVSFAQRARELLDHAGYRVDYHESDVAHTIDPARIPDAASWLDTVIGG